jgi:hypothetical protein
VAGLSTTLAMAIVPSVTFAGPVLVLLATLVAATTAAIAFTGLVRGSRSGLRVRRYRLVPSRYELRCQDVDAETAGDLRPAPCVSGRQAQCPRVGRPTGTAAGASRPAH